MRKIKLLKRVISALLVISMMLVVPYTSASAEEATEQLSAIKMDICWGDTVAEGQVVSRICLKSMEGKTINAGDTLSYQVYIPSDGNYVYGMGAFDGQASALADSGYWFPNFEDGAGKNNYCQLDEQGTDCWITREYKFTTTAQFWHLGPAILNSSSDTQAMAGKVSTIYYRNIMIKRADGTQEIFYGDNAAMGEYHEVQSITENKCTISLEEGTYMFQKEEIGACATGTDSGKIAKGWNRI